VPENYPQAIHDLVAKGLGGGHLCGLPHLRVAGKLTLSIWRSELGAEIAFQKSNQETYCESNYDNKGNRF
jgi:hypothetical protein